ncbi:MAG TPA: chromate transporter [Methylomirabilota bacterium]|nr:chromate transporter [Methylomirabilota bacterium]
MPTIEPPTRLTLGELFRGFLGAGARGFGGTLPWARRMMVEERRWLTEREFIDTFSLCNFLPGPNVASMAVIVGARYRGLPGSVAALAGLLTVPLATILTLAFLYGRFGQQPGVDAALRGMGAAAAGLVLATGLRMAAALGRAPRVLLFLVAAFVAVAVMRWPLLPVLLGLGPVSVLAAWVGSLALGRARA